MYIRTQIGEKLVNTDYVKMIYKAYDKGQKDSKIRVECLFNDNNRMQLGRYNSMQTADDAICKIAEAMETDKIITLPLEDNH